MTLVLSARAAEPVRRGHPWVYREQLTGAQLRDGEDVRLTFKDEVIAHGIGAQTGPLAVRVWTHGNHPIDGALVRERLAQAVALRARWFAAEQTTAYRVIHGEGDRMPGLVVDRYGEVAVVVIDDDGLRARWDDILPALTAALIPLGVTTVLLRTGRRGEAKHVTRVVGDVTDMRPVVREHGVPFVVDLEHGQKTGAFLDQRENRRRVGELAHGRRVLNLFSYAGGFSLRAALGGATHVTSVDIAAQGHATAQESFKRAGVSPSAHEFVTQDCFSFLEQAQARKLTWDLVVSDPPSFAPNAKSLPKALSAYRALHRACAAVVAKDGILCAASCSSHVDAETFTSTLDDVALATDRFRLVALHGAPCDHPTLPAFPEGRYLKFAVMVS
jgi:23S rRNA (cytosine1962-C5)-methyltransferase